MTLASQSFVGPSGYLLSLESSLLAALVAAGLLSDQESAWLLAAVKERKLSTIAWLVQQKRIDAKIIAEQLANCLKLEFFSLSQFDSESVIPDVVDETLVGQYRILPLFIKSQNLYVAISEPAHLSCMGEIKFQTDLNVYPMVVEWDKLERLITAYLSEAQYRSLTKIPLAVVNDDLITSWVEQMLQDALHKGVSDIHLEPYKTAYRIRFRLDGILHKVAQLPLDAGNRITARLKVMSRLDMAERRLPQDGRFSLEVKAQEARDCRISICPTLLGEKVVVRILDAGQMSLQVDDLGLEKVQKAQFLQAIKKPQGMILVTGPTGSGKTITLYTALNFLNSVEKNICTVEDPVEIVLPGINQIHVAPKIQLTFAKALRSFLRQDPDILMLGEIRDQETAETAVNAAQTGHLVLSTLHTNSAVETLTRLSMLGISALNIAQSVQLIIAQRLVRKLCVHCRRLQTGSHEIYQAVGCDHCMKGYKGRVAVFEFLPVSTDIGSLLTQGKPDKVILEAAKNFGMISLQTAMLQKVAAGVTTMEEMQRVIYS